MTQFRIEQGIQRARHLYASGRATQQTPYILQVVQEILLQQLGPRAHDIDQGVSGEDLAAVFGALPNRSGKDGSYIHAWNNDYWVWQGVSLVGGVTWNVTKVGERKSLAGWYPRLGSILGLKGIDYNSLNFYTGGL